MTTFGIIIIAVAIIGLFLTVNRLIKTVGYLLECAALSQQRYEDLEKRLERVEMRTI